MFDSVTCAANRTTANLAAARFGGWLMAGGFPLP
jgi:hypothetical protein